MNNNSDTELNALKDERDKLLQKLIQLRDKLADGDKSQLDNKILLSLDECGIQEDVLTNRMDTETSPTEKFVVKLVEATQAVSGITYENINKIWLREDVWSYTADVSMKVLNFKLDLTVDVKDKDETDILDITCHFDRVDASCLQEIQPWVREFTEKKQFSVLMSTFSEYVEYSLIRSRILSKLESENFVTLEENDKEGGGIISYVHSPRAVKKIILKVIWGSEANSKTKSLDHSFVIDVLENGFGEANEELLRAFCVKSLKREDLENLWRDLCAAVEEYN